MGERYIGQHTILLVAFVYLLNLVADNIKSMAVSENHFYSKFI